MGKFTEGAKQINAWSYHKTASVAKFNSLTASEDYASDLSVLHKTSLHGSVVVKDMTANNHLLQFAATVETKGKTRHVEDELFKKLNAWAETGRGLSAAKIIFFIRNSPCQRCTGKLFANCQALAGKIGRGTGEFQFSFVFKNYYLSGDFGWPDTETAEDAYSYVVQQSVSDWCDLPKYTTKVLIRHYDETKGAPNAQHFGFKEAFPTFHT